MIRILKILFFILLITSSRLKSQEIDFGDYYSYTGSLTELNPLSSLNFGELISNQGTVSLGLSEAKIFALEGVKYLDVTVTITETDLINTDGGCTGNCTIPYTLEAAYVNLGSVNLSPVTPMTVSGNMASAQFPILKRTSGAPGPPPTPVYEGFDPTVYNETAYIYVYGSINVGSVNAGTYVGDISVTVSYD